MVSLRRHFVPNPVPLSLAGTRSEAKRKSPLFLHTRYEAYGQLVQSTGSTLNPFRFVGRLGYYFDQDLAEYYVRARHYDPRLARWLAVDPIGYDAGPNLYEYAGNSPAIFFDPFGLSIEWGPGPVGVDCYTASYWVTTTGARVTKATGNCPAPAFREMALRKAALQHLEKLGLDHGQLSEDCPEGCYCSYGESRAFMNFHKVSFDFEDIYWYMQGGRIVMVHLGFDPANPGRNGPCRLEGAVGFQVEWKLQSGTCWSDWR